MTEKPSASDAFPTLEARADALKSDQILDRISLRDHTVEVEIGAFEVERNVTQRLSFNIVVELMPLPKDLGDDVDRILSYDTLTEAVQTELAAERLNLLETLCERVADRVLRAPQAVKVFVRIEKLDRGPGALGVEIVRSVEDISQDCAGPNAAQVQPTIVHLSASALTSLALPQWIEMFAGQEQPIILTVGETLSDTSQETDNSTAQRRIDLLSLEQTAWRLSAKHPSCLVHGTRTELDWAMKHGVISIWAPSKMVLDAVNGPDGDAICLAAWLAGELGARELVLLSEDLPQGCNIRDIPTRSLDLSELISLF